MSFIAIDAKADIADSKKGKLTPAQHAQLNAFCLTKKTGIFDCLGKCEYISPISIDSANHKATITFNSGYVVICGRLVECEAGTEFVADLPVSGEESGYIVLRYDLSAFGENEFKVIQKTGSLTQQDLNNNPIDGVYEFPLYSYTATPSSITLTRELIQGSPYIHDISRFIFDNAGIENQVRVPKDDLKNDDASRYLYLYYNADGRRGLFDTKQGRGRALVWFDSQDVARGDFDQITLNGTDLETRLTNLGFRQDVVTLASGVTASTNEIKRQGNYVFCNIVFSNFSKYATDGKQTYQIGTIPNLFLPESTVETGIQMTTQQINIKPNQYDYCTISAFVVIDTYGVITLHLNTNRTSGYSNTQCAFSRLNFGYKASPL